ncbi:hypothetical protein [Adhaeretor mobilis]|nr:hypothetical protein [Adhaeretor mobilis]
MNLTITSKFALLWCATLSATILCQVAYAHNGGILVQAAGGKLVTGFDNATTGNQTIGDRAFSLVFPSSLSNDVPSFSSLANAPIGSEALPVGGELYWDFLPMTHAGMTSNLLYWDGLGTTTEDVEFGAVPSSDTRLRLYTDQFADNAFVDGSPDMVPGKLIDTVSSSNLALHAHRWFYLGPEFETGPAPPEGVYLFAMQLRMEGYENTDPFFIAAGTDEISAATLDNITLPWVQDNLDTLIVDESGTGDFDNNGDVDGSDFLRWQRDISTPGELSDWQVNYGSESSPAAIASLAVPEPGTALLATLTLGLVSVRRRERTGA